MASTTRYEQIRDWISEFFDPRILRVRKPVTATIGFLAEEVVESEELKDFIVNGSDVQVTPLITFLTETYRAEGSKLDPMTDTEPNSAERQSWVLLKLGLLEVQEEIQQRFPQPKKIVVVDDVFHDWYTASREAENSNYWNDYQKVLERKGWTAESIETVNQQAREVIRRMADPRGEDERATRGLVVGYVQSGKTANFTAVAAKAIDAGYRMIIVLAGTLDNLRYQTQRRLDMELFGREAVLAGRDEDTLSAAARKQESYFNDDEDWHSDLLQNGRGFIEHGDGYGKPGFPRISRLTTSNRKGDYKGSIEGIQLSDFVKNAEGLSDKALDAMPCYVAVVKKNKSVLRKLNEDLARSKKEGYLQRLPILVIDDESDQASINTRNNSKKTSTAEKDRTAVNEQITALLAQCHPAQYVGYTATPFANVFVDPSDPQDLYPKNFALMLEEPPAYRGAKWFHDRMNFTGSSEEATVANSQSKAFVREIVEEPEDSDDPDFGNEREKELKTALDMFVLTGAIKKYREAQGKGSYKHHTMLVHEAVGKESHRDARDLLVRLWHEAGYLTPNCHPALKRLFEDDVVPVLQIEHYTDGFAVPPSFDELAEFIPEAVQEMVRGVSRDTRAPIYTINSEDGEEADFDSGKVWKVLVGGLKLSRGYTVEGLTVSYFRRRARTADTLMQTGRWFGFRKGYQDLVRLYAPQSLIELFEASMQDEEQFRDFVARYKALDEQGGPKFTPLRLAPLVRQTLPHLKPTAKNKMFNAVIRRSASAPGVADLSSLPTNPVDLKHNNRHVALPLLQKLEAEPKTLAWFRQEIGNSSAGVGEFFVGTVEAKEFIGLLELMRWYKAPDEKPNERGVYFANNIRPRIDYLESLLGEDDSDPDRCQSFFDTAILMPHPKRGDIRTIEVPGLQIRVPLLGRKRRGSTRHDLTGSDRKHTYPLESIAAGKPATIPRKHDLRELSAARQQGFRNGNYEEPFPLGVPGAEGRAAVLLMFFDDRPKETIRANPDALPCFDKGEVGFAMSFNSPHAAVEKSSQAVEWSVRVPGKEKEIVVDEAEVEAKEI